MPKGAKRKPLSSLYCRAADLLRFGWIAGLHQHIIAKTAQLLLCEFTSPLDLAAVVIGIDIGGVEVRFTVFVLAHLCHQHGVIPQNEAHMIAHADAVKTSV